MAMAGWKTDDMLDGLSGIMNLAAAAGSDLGTTSDIVTDALTAFGKSAEDSGRLADIMAAASSNANTNVEMMGETFKYAAPVAGALGYSMEDTAVAVGLMANAGIKASQAGTSIRTGLTRLVAPTEKAAQAMTEYGISVTDTDGNMLSFHDLMEQVRQKLGGLDEAEQAAAVSAIFGKNAMSGWLAIVNSSDEDFESLTNSINNSDGAAQRMADTMQNNLQGKVTLFNSAMEGLGNALYEYFSGPLSLVVSMATNYINGITDSLTPQQTALKKFSDSVKQSNAEVKAALDHANETVENAHTRAAELQAYSEEFTGILGQCEQFNQITLENGEKAVVDASGKIVTKIGDVGKKATDVDGILDQFASDGFKTDGIKGSSDTAQEMIGYVEERAITAKTAIEGISDESTVAAISSAVTGLGNLEGATQNVYHITDEFTKSKINYMIEEMGESVGDLAKAWNAETGELTASHEELEKWFNTAKDVALYTALQDAIQEYYEAWGQASASVVKANSEMKEALKAFNDEYGTSVTTYEEFKELIDSGAAEWDDYADAVRKAHTHQQMANRHVEQAEEALETTAAEMEEYKDTVFDTTAAQDENTQSAEESKTALELLEEQEEDTTETTEDLSEAQQKAAESIKAFQEMSGSSIEELKALQEQLQMSDQEFGEWCQNRVDEVQPIIDEYNSLVENIQQSMQSFVEGLYTSGEEGNAAIDNIVANLESRNADLQTWVENMKYLGERAGKDLPQALYDELVAGGPEKTKEAVAELVKAAQNETGQFEQVAQEYEKGLELQSSAETLASYTAVGKEYEEAVKDGFVGSLEDYKKTVEEGTQSAADAGKAKAEETGAEAGETLAEEAASGVEESTGEVEAASEAMIEASRDAAEQVASDFHALGQKIPQKLRQGIKEADFITEKAGQELIDTLQTELNKSLSMAYNIGKDIASAIKNGIDEMSYEPELSIENLLAEISDACTDKASDIESAGGDLAYALADGIAANGSTAVQNAGNIADSANDAIASWTNAWYNTGYYMTAGLADGIYSGKSRAIDAAAAVASSALARAKRELDVRSPSHKFEELGKMSDEGLAKGFEDNIGMVTSQVEDSMYEVMKSAQSALDDKNVEVTANAVNNISTDSMRTLGSIASVRGSVGDVASVINAFRAEVASRMAELNDVFTEQGNRRATVTLQVGNKKFDAYIVDTASRGMGAMSQAMARGVGLV